jgi:hypothetical protein
MFGMLQQPLTILKHNCEKLKGNGKLSVEVRPYVPEYLCIPIFNITLIHNILSVVIPRLLFKAVLHLSIQKGGAGKMEM